MCWEDFLNHVLLGGPAADGNAEVQPADPEAVAHTVRGWRKNARVGVSWTALWT